MLSSRQITRFTPRVVMVAAFAAFLTVGNAAASTYTITLDGTPVTAITTTGGEKVALNFAGTTGHRVSVRVSSATIPSYTIAIKAPDGTVLKTSGTWGVGGGFLAPVTLATTGTFKIFITPTSSTAKGRLVVSAWDVPADLNSAIATDGTLTTDTFVAPGQNGKLTFSGTAGQRISMVAGTGSSTAKNAAMSIKAPSGATVLASTAVGFSGMFFEPITLAETGTFTITVNPPTYTVGTVNVQVWSVPADQTGTLTMGGGNQVLSFPTPGQNASLTFAGTSGQKVTLAISPVSLINGGATVRIRKPDTTLLSTIAVTNSGALLEPTTLPATGTYTVSVDPTSQATGSITLSLYLSPSDLSGTLTSGTPSTLTFGSIGQNASYTISGTANQYLALKFANDSISSTSVSVKTPASTTLIPATSFTTSGHFFDAVVLPATGTYTITVNPQTVSTGSVDVTAYVFTSPSTQAATLGVPLTVTTVPGQNAAITFTAPAAPNKVSIMFTGVTAGTTTTTGIAATLSTGGTTVANFPQQFGNSDKFLEPMTLTAGATYKLLLDPSGTNAGSITTTIYSVPADPIVAGTIGGAGSVVTVGTPGQGAKLTFTGTAGHLLSIWFSGVTIGNPINLGTVVTLTSPTGATVTTTTPFLYEHDTMMEPVVLPSTGTYTMSFNPYGSYTGSLTATLYDVPADATNTAIVGGSGVTATTTVPGQSGQISFTTTSNTPVTILYDVTSCCPANISVLLGGVVVKTASSHNPGDSLSFTPAAGTNTYVIKIDPTVNNVGDLTIFVG
jgi:hypothetical protein